MLNNSDQVAMFQIGWLLSKHLPANISMPQDLQELSDVCEKYFGYKPMKGEMLNKVLKQVEEAILAKAYNRAMKIL